MISIICYGDSNTFAFTADKRELRFPPEERWTNLLNSALGDDYQVFNEGLNGRTTAYDWPEKFQLPGGEDRNGLRTLPERLNAYKKIDIFVIMLGTNDCSYPLELSPEKITNGMEQLILAAKEIITKKQGNVPKIIVVAPAPILPETEGTIFSDQIDETSARKSRDIVPLYKALAEKYGCGFVDASMCEVNRLDCEHLTKKGHEMLADLLVEEIRTVEESK